MKRDPRHARRSRRMRHQSLGCRRHRHLLHRMAAFFNGSETALTAASRARMHALEKWRQARSRVNRLLGNRDRLIGAILLGNTLVSIGSSALLDQRARSYLRYRWRPLCHRPDDRFCSSSRKSCRRRLAINFPDRTALSVAPVISFFVAIFGPVLAAVEAFVHGAAASLRRQSTRQAPASVRP